MKNTTKIIVGITLLSTIGISSLAKSMSTSSVKFPVTTISSLHKPFSVAKAVGGDGDGETNDDILEQQEEANLQSLAKISPQQAQQIAENTIGNRASQVKLENEDGNLVYSVIIGEKDVKVDAGNGKILYIDHPNAETPEKNRPRSSIRISESAEGDGDGETNDDG